MITSGIEEADEEQQHGYGAETPHVPPLNTRLGGASPYIPELLGHSMPVGLEESFGEGIIGVRGGQAVALRGQGAVGRLAPCLNTAARHLGTTEEIYEQIVRGKTAAMFQAAIEVGAEISGAEDKTVQAFGAYGDALGVSFQIVDDLLDWGATAGELGKNTGDDFRECKLTLPIIRAVAQADDAEREFWVRTVQKGRQEDGDLEQARALLDKHSALQSTRETALMHADRAKAAMRGLPEHPLREMLIDLADYVVQRIR